MASRNLWRLCRAGLLLHHSLLRSLRSLRLQRQTRSPRQTLLLACWQRVPRQIRS